MVEVWQPQPAAAMVGLVVPFAFELVDFPCVLSFFVFIFLRCPPGLPFALAFAFPFDVSVALAFAGPVKPSFRPSFRCPFRFPFFPSILPLIGVCFVFSAICCMSSISVTFGW